MKRRLGQNSAQYTSPQPTSPQFLADLDRGVALNVWGSRFDIVPGYTGNGTQLAQVEAKLKAIKNRGLHAHAMLSHWLTDDKRQHTDGASLTKLADFAAAVYHSLGSQIDSWELGNEPNITTFAPDGANPEYQAAVSAAFAKALPAGANICSPGLSPASDSGKNLSPVTYSRRYWAALDSATAAKLTGAGIHLYGTPKDIGQSWSTYHQLAAISTASGNRPQEVTEFNGYTSGTAAARAMAVADGLAWLKSTSIPIGRVFVYEMSTQGSEPPYGVYDAHGTASPTLAVLQAWRDGTLQIASEAERADLEAALDVLVKKPHCKNMAHLAVSVTHDAFPQHLTAMHLAALACVNTDYTGPGVVVSHHKGHPLDGLHLLPDAIVHLPAKLRDVAATATAPGATVEIGHTVNTNIEKFAAMTPATAVQLAHEIEAAA